MKLQIPSVASREFRYPSGESGGKFHGEPDLSNISDSISQIGLIDPEGNEEPDGN